MKRFVTTILLLLYSYPILAFVWNHQPYSPRSSLASSSSSDCTTDLLSMVKGKTLTSVKETLDIFNECNKDYSNKSRIKFIDASWWHKGPKDAGRIHFEKGPRIPNSIYFDVDDICLPSELNPMNLPHMLPPSNIFSAVMDHFHVSEEDHIFIYARESVIFTPRTWFIFRAFGHDPAKIHLMQGSLEEWIGLGGPVEDNFQPVPRVKHIMEQFQNVDGSFVPRYRAFPSPKNVCDMHYMLKIVDTNNVNSSKDETGILIDSRGSSFHKSGHIPGSIHIPYSSYTTSDNSLKMKSIQELHQVFKNAGIDPLTNQRIIATCGSGVSVCHTLLALELCGRNLEHDFMYDGSWAEWSMDDSTPKV